MNPAQKTAFKKPLAATALVLLLCLLPQPAKAQGCTQCRDNTAATPPQTQSAYRHAIYLLAGAASSLFLLSVLILRRTR